MDGILLTPEQASAQGYIFLEKAVELLKPNAPNRTTLWQCVKTGKKPGCKVSRGSKIDYWMLKTSLLSKEPVDAEKDYQQLWKTWLKGMESGIFAHKHKPVSRKYIDDALVWGMTKY